MNIEFWNIGKDQYRFVSDAVSLYEQRILKHVPIEVKRFDGKKEWKNASSRQLIQEQSTFLADKLKGEEKVVLLDEAGKSMDSVSFAQWLNEQMVYVPGKLVFICGGAYGLDRSIFTSGNMLLSLSSMTLSHQIVRIVFMEQLYRALSILKNEPYHN